MPTNNRQRSALAQWNAFLAKIGVRPDAFELTPSGDGFTYEFRGSDTEAEAFSIGISNPGMFKPDVFYAEHRKEARCSDGGCSGYRSWINQFGKGSLQVVHDRTHQTGFFDRDKYNLQDLRNVFGHVFLEYLPAKLGRVFRQAS